MISPFENDMFSLIREAFANLYPDKKVLCEWDTHDNIVDDANGVEAFGITWLDSETGVYHIKVDAELKVVDAVEIFTHELAHAAVGLEHDHDDMWDNAFDSIFNEYNRIGYLKYESHSSVEVTDGKAYKRN